MNRIYRKVKGVEGLECTSDGHFIYNGRPKKVIYATKNFGNGKATARIVYMRDGKTHYIQAAKAVAMAWKSGYDEEIHSIVYKDSDIHNISADNLSIVTHKDYEAYRMRMIGPHEADSVKERIRKLQLVIEEASMTKRYFETLDMEPINAHVKDYLFDCLARFCKESLHLGDRTTLEVVPECLARMYECILNGMCLYNYERYCKKLLLNYRKKGNFGFTGCVPKPIEIIVSQLNTDCLWERYRKSNRR